MEVGRDERESALTRHASAMAFERIRAGGGGMPHFQLQLHTRRPQELGVQSAALVECPATRTWQAWPERRAQQYRPHLARPLARIQQRAGQLPHVHRRVGPSKSGRTQKSVGNHDASGRQRKIAAPIGRRGAQRGAPLEPPRQPPALPRRLMPPCSPAEARSPTGAAVEGGEALLPPQRVRA